MAPQRFVKLETEVPNEAQKLLGQFGMVASMSHRGNCCDNAPMESFWGLTTQKRTGVSPAFQNPRRGNPVYRRVYRGILQTAA